MEHECLICCERDGKFLYKVCNCNTYIHIECFEKMINMVSSHNTHCAVCKQKYSIKKTLSGCVISDFKNSYILTIFDFLLIPFLFACIYVVYSCNNIKITEYAIMVSIFCLLSSIILISWFFVRYLYYIRTKSLCCIKPIWKRSAMTFKNKNPKIVYFV